MAWRRGVAAIAGELSDVGEADLTAGGGDRQGAVDHLVTAGVTVAGAAGQWCGTVEKGARPGDDLGAAGGVVTAGAGGALVLGNRVGAVQRVIERAPARVGGVQGVARVHHRHHQLRPGDMGNLGIDIARVDGEIGAFRLQIADLGQKRLIGGEIQGLAGTRLVPGVDLRLQVVAFGQQGAVDRRQVVDNRRQTGPEGGGIDTATGQGLVHDETIKAGVDGQAVGFNAIGHCLSFLS